MKTIETRLTVRLLIGVAASLILSGSVVYLATRAFMIREFDATLTVRLNALAGFTQLDRDGIQIEPVADVMREYDRTNATAFFQLWATENRVIAKSKGLGKSSLASPDAPFGSTIFWPLTLPNGEKGRAAARRFVPVVDDELPPKEPPVHPETNVVTLAVAVESGQIADDISIIAIALSCTAALAFAAVVLALRRGIRRELQPLVELSEFTAGISATTLAAKFPTAQLPDELLPIATRLNELLSRLNEAFSREKQFTADAAHELRTPLAELRSLVEVALKWPQDAETSGATFREAHSVVLRMETLLNNLLLIARGENDRANIIAESVPLAGAISDAWKMFEPVAKDRGLSVSFSIGDIRLHTDRILFGQVLRNLLGNAAAHAPRNGAINVSTSGWDNAGALLIVNDCEGLTADDAAHFGERFWRKDQVRGEGGHAGLGLSVVVTICKAIGLCQEFSISENRFQARLSWPPDAADNEQALPAARDSLHIPPA